MSKIIQELFNSWKFGSDEAFKAAWEILWNKFYTFAIMICGGDEDCANDGFQDAIIELYKEVKNGDFDFRGEDSFYSYVRQKIKFRCLDKLREKERRWGKITSLDEDLVGQDGDNESIPYHEIVPANGETPEEEVINNERVKNFLEGFYSIRCKLPKSLRDIIYAGLDAEEPDIKRKDLWKKVCEKLNISRNTLYLRLRRLRAIYEALYGSTKKSR